MISFLSLLVHVVISPFKAQAQLEAEILLLRHQLNVLRRQVSAKPKLTVVDRQLFVWVVFGAAHLRRILAVYAAYYNDFRTHLALAKDPPLLRPIQRFGQITARPILGGLHHEYCRI
jgi:hypothetical protein